MRTASDTGTDMEARIVTLTRPDCDWIGLEDLAFISDMIFQPTRIEIFTHDLTGSPLLISRAYVDQLQRNGWIGVDQIPPECIVEP
jgi:hypothetical protein